MHLAPDTARAAGCCALLLAPLLAGCAGGDFSWPPAPDDSAADTGAAPDSGDTGETSETGTPDDSVDPLDPCSYIPCSDTETVELEQPFVGPYVWFCDTAQLGASYTVALNVEITAEITAEDAAAAILETEYDLVYAAKAGLPPTVYTTGVAQDSTGRPLLDCTWDVDLGLFREERLTLRGG